MGCQFWALGCAALLAQTGAGCSGDDGGGAGSATGAFRDVPAAAAPTPGGPTMAPAAGTAAMAAGAGAAPMAPMTDATTGGGAPPAGDPMLGNDSMAGNGMTDDPMAGDEPMPGDPAGDGPMADGPGDDPMVDDGTQGDAAPSDGSVAGIDDAELGMLRQFCVDEINMYRATLGLAPLQRATPEQELCSDRGAELDATTGRAHGSSGRGNPCAQEGNSPGFGSQNTCPGWPARGAIATALGGCLAGMWAEGEPPEGEEKCIQDYFNGDSECFLAHGHYINMKGDSRGVACGFYNMGGDRYWMNQDFF